MSTVAKTDAAASSGAAAPPKKKGRKMVIAAALVVLAGGGGAAFWFLRPAEASAPAQGEAQHDAAAQKGVPQYYKFDPAFVVNFGGPGNARYLQINLEAMSRDTKVIDEIKVVEPAIRNDLMMLFSSQQYEDLLTQEGKEKLRLATLDTVRKALAAEGTNGEAVERVYFTSLVIQ
jgi:flagellar FliL protein